MKKLFKKSIACLIAVLMVVSTMPFTAVTASAATLTETDIANATTNRVVIKDAIYTYASSSAYYNYGTTISTESDWNTPITSTSTITKVECLDDASVLSVTDGKLSGSFASNTFKVSGATDVFATLKFTFSDGKVEYHKVAVKSYPVENHIACEAVKIGSFNSRTESGYTMFMRGSTGSGGADGVWKFQKSYATSGTGTHAMDGTNGIITSDKKAYAHGYSEGGDAVPNVITKATYYVDKSCRNTNWSTLGNSELWNGTNYVVPIEVVRTRFFHDSGTANWNFDLNNMPVQGKLVRTDSNGRNDTNGTTYGLTFTHNASVNESNRYTQSNDTTCNVRVAMRTTDKGWALLKTDLIVKLFDKSVARNLYTTCLNSAIDSSDYTASSFLAYQNALLEMEAYLSNYEDATDATTSQAVYTNLNNAKNSLQSLYCTVTFSDAFFNTTTVKVREGATVPADQFPTLPSPRQSSNKTQHTRYYFKNTADGTEFTTTTVVTSNVSVIETTKVEDCSGGEATCSALAVCDVCKSTYGSLNADNHKNTRTVDAKASTCTEAGWEAYTYCDDCNKVVGEKVDLPLAKHEYEVTKKDDTHHIYNCKNCTDSYEEAHAWGEYAETTPATCTKNAIETATCTVDGCGATTSREVENSALGHDYQYTELDADSHTVTCSRCDLNETEAHNFEGGNTCTKCLYEKSTIDTTAYDNAVVEYNSIIGADDYAAKYTEASRTAYQAAVEAAKKNSFATQDEVNAAVAAILSAKTKLVYAQPEIKFVEVDANGNETVIETKNYTYGTPVEFTKNADNIAKWIVKTQNGKVETKVATSETTYTMIATEPATVYVHLTEEKTETVQYSKVSFISKNGAVSSVQYVEVGKTLNTIDVPGVKIPFYEFKNWNKASVTADGSDIEVKAVYEFIGTEENKCRVHYDGFDGGVKEYTYDSFVYLFGAENKTLALASDAAGTNIITYLNENAFYAPHTADIYVIEVDSQPASIGITGSYASSTEDKKTAAFNCKFFLPEGCTVVEYGLTATSSTGKSIKIKAETASARGEYCVKVSMANTSTVTSVDGVAYLTYKDAYNNLHTIYSTTVTQNL